MRPPVNPFVAAETAEVYARGRPYFHPLVVEKVKEKLELNAPVKLAVDVACGTGLSTWTLLAIAEQVIGTDTSAVMLQQAPKDARITYVQAPAEALPLENESVDLVTVSSAFHWFDRQAFLRQARRVLRSGGWLVIYENFFRGHEHANTDFTAWLGDYYASHPSPPRDREPFTAKDAEKAGFTFEVSETYENTWSFALPDFGAYLMSQSNAVAAIARGQDSAESLKLKLTEELGSFFAKGDVTMPFAGFIWILRRLRYA